MRVIYFPLLFVGYGGLLLVAAIGAVIFFWITLGSGRVSRLLIYCHIAAALLTFGLLTWAVAVHAGVLL